MENQLVDLKLRIQELEKENIALKSKMTLMYSNWQFDFNKYTLLKEKCRRSPNNPEDDDHNTVIRCNSPEDKTDT